MTDYFDLIILCSLARTIADVLCEDEPVEETTAVWEQASPSSIGITFTASGRDEDLYIKFKGITLVNQANIALNNYVLIDNICIKY